MKTLADNDPCQHIGKVQCVKHSRDGMSDDWRCVECGARMTHRDLSRNIAAFDDRTLPEPALRDDVRVAQ